MAQVVWTVGALQDVDEIASYIAERNPDAARKLVRQVFERVELLRQFLELGRFEPELPGQVHRRLVIRPCKVIYRIEHDAAVIEAVVRGERLMTEQLLKRRKI
jgi:toxin ParE1/3/4